ncbi:chorismate-binding protein [Dechloromonas sp. ZY10]|uniref:isochorismate synthase n=1 Tax=Dechloromonas aquae TaxID=2664436 RepID=UPI003529688E
MSDFRPLLQAWLDEAANDAAIASWQGQPPGDRLITLQLELGDYTGNWLEYLPVEPTYFCYQATPAHRDYRLGLGQAWRSEANGNRRLDDLANNLAATRKNWQGTQPAELLLAFPFHAGAQPDVPGAVLELPALWLIATGGRARACFSCRLREFSSQQQAVLKLLADGTHPTPEPVACPAQMQPINDYAAWEQRVHHALQAIDNGPLKKLVLAREIEVCSEQPFAPATILQRLLNQDGSGLTYARGTDRQCFLGTTPETLVALDAGKITADALAGTAWPNSPHLEDSKNSREQHYVVTAVAAALAPWCQPDSVQIAPREKCPAGQLQHWRSRVSGQALPTTTLLQLATALHPTPAVGGFPPLAAWRWLEAAGEQRTAWYSGGIGRIDAAGNGQLWVALRSALLAGGCARLQAGAGIVAGSDALTEYRETEAKLGSMLAALQP